MRWRRPSSPSGGFAEPVPIDRRWTVTHFTVDDTSMLHICGDCDRTIDQFSIGRDPIYPAASTPVAVIIRGITVERRLV